MAKVALGKGLGALITPRVVTPEPALSAGERVQKIALAEIVPSPLQPRKEIRAEQLQELTDSIRAHGVIQPLIVRRIEGKFELIAGERRWRASKEVGLAEAPVIVREASDQEVLELALVENIQREDLNPIEEAQAYVRLAREFGVRQEDIAQKVGKSRAAVANAMRLLELHPQVQSWVAQGRISVGHGKVLLSLKVQDEQLLVAENIVRHSATVRAAEKMVGDHLAARSGGTGGSPASRKAQLAPAIQHLQNRLQQHLATHVVVHHGDRKGRIEIEYYGNDDLQRVLSVIGLKAEAL